MKNQKKLKRRQFLLDSIAFDGAAMFTDPVADLAPNKVSSLASAATQVQNTNPRQYPFTPQMGGRRDGL